MPTFVKILKNRVLPIHDQKESIHTAPVYFHYIIRIFINIELWEDDPVHQPIKKGLVHASGWRSRPFKPYNLALIAFKYLMTTASAPT
jgi:hypothetical protein